MSDHAWDAIVVGAGLGGLLSAAMLARRGRRVLVLEREAEVGGRLRSFEDGGYVIDAGAYLWPNAHLGDALAAAGATDFVASRIPLERILRVFVQGDGGRPRDFPWPGRPPSPALSEAARVILRADAPTFARLAELWERLAALSDAEVDALRHTTLADALPRFTGDAALAAALRRNVMIFGTYDPDSASMADCIGLRRRRPGATPAWPECPGANPGGGVRALPLALRRACAAAGGALRLGWTVEQIVVAGGRVTGVRARGGDGAAVRLDSAVVICNAPVWQLVGLLEPGDVPPGLAASARGCGVVGGVIAAAFAFDGLPRLRSSGAPDEFPGWTRLLIGADAGFGGGMLWATHHSPHNAPAGHHVLQAMRLSPAADLADPARVRAVHDAFDALLDEIYLDAAARLRRRWTWVTPDGSEYMIHAARRPPVESPIAGLYCVGESTDVGAVQMDAAALSALRCAERVAPQV